MIPKQWTQFAYFGGIANMDGGGGYGWGVRDIDEGWISMV